MTDIVDRIAARIARDQASDREVARLTGQTIEEYDADTTAPDQAGGADVLAQFHPDRLEAT